MTPIQLLPIDDALAAALEDGADAFAARYGAALGEAAEPARAAVRQTVAWLAANPRPAAWGAFLAVDAATAAVVGACAFKHPPTPDGAVEIAYGTFPPFERRGYATAMAAALAARAAAAAEVRRVVAHTLPERNASARLLARLGFTHVGEVIDPDDGRVWRWERAVLRTPCE